jgi:hypothetical protein
MKNISLKHQQTQKSRLLYKRIVRYIIILYYAIKQEKLKIKNILSSESCQR